VTLKVELVAIDDQSTGHNLFSDLFSTGNLAADDLEPIGEFDLPARILAMPEGVLRGVWQSSPYYSIRPLRS
jgi:hypothetical protein